MLLVCISEAVQSLENDFATICLFVLPAVVQQHQTCGQDEIQLSACDGPQPSPVRRSILLHEDGRRIDATNRAESDLKTRCHPEEVSIARSVQGNCTYIRKLCPRMLFACHANAGGILAFAPASPMNMPK